MEANPVFTFSDESLEGNLIRMIQNDSEICFRTIKIANHSEVIQKTF